MLGPSISHPVNTKSWLPDSGEYRSWIAELKRRYRVTQIKAATSVNTALLEYYWNLGKDISERYADAAAYGMGFFDHLSADMKSAMPGLSSKVLHELTIPLPPLAEQKRIVAKLEELLPLCERLKSESNSAANS